MKNKFFLLFLLALAITSGIALGTIIKETKQGKSIEFFTNESGTVSKSAELTPGGTLKVKEVTDLAGTGTPPGMVPVGGMIAVMPNVTGAWQPPATTVVKDGFMRADGALVTDADSPMNGQNLPNMVDQFTRGAATSGVSAGNNNVTPTGTNTLSAFAGDAEVRTNWLGSSAISATISSHRHSLEVTGAAARVGFVASTGGSYPYVKSYADIVAGLGNSVYSTYTIEGAPGSVSTSASVSSNKGASLVGNTGYIGGGVVFNANNDNMADWAASGDYTPTGTMTQPTFTGDSQTNMPVHTTVVWVIRVK